MKKKIVAIAGPTAVGKTSLSIRLAKYYNTEIISADSRQFYKELNIGTAKPSPEELSFVRHHFINSHSVSESYNVYDYEKDVDHFLESFFKTKDLILLTGGTGLYINAVCHGLDEVPEADPQIREDLIALFEKQGTEALSKLLAEKDPKGFIKVDPNNPQRMIRALEVVLSTGKSLFDFHKQHSAPKKFDALKIGLTLPRDVLYDRINNRVDQMIEEGLLEEVKGLTETRNYNALQTVGYKELFAFLDKEISFDRAVELIKQNTRRYAKRQLTWFNRDQEITWFRPDEDQKIIAHIDAWISRS